MADIFISYSRTDAAFVEVLRNALLAARRDVWLDKTDIPATAAWLSEIYAAIDAASAVIIVLSPDYLASETCQQELARALEGQKKLIPIVCREVNAPDVPAELRALNWIFWRMADNSDQAFATVLSALDTDLDYVRGGARWLVRARDWDAKTRNPSFTLRGKELLEAEQWVTSSGGKIPPPAPLALEYINASRVFERGRQRRTVGALTTGIIVTLALAILSTVLYGVTRSQNVTLHAQNTSLQAAAIAGRANEALVNNHIDQGLLLSLAAVQHANNIDTRSALVNALEYSPNLETVLESETQASSHDVFLDAAYSADGQTLMTMSEYYHITLWNVATRQPRLIILTPKLDSGDVINDAAFSADGAYVATQQAESGVILWNARTGAQIAVLDTGVIGQSIYFPAIAFSPDSRLLGAIGCADDQCQQAQISVWNVAARQLVWRAALDFPGSLIAMGFSIAFSPNSAQLAVSECDDISRYCPHSKLLLFATNNGGLLASAPFALADKTGSIEQMAFSPDGRTLALGGCAFSPCHVGQTALWDVASRRVTRTFIEDDDDVISLAFSPDGAVLATAAQNGVLRLWNVAQGTPLGNVLRGHSKLINRIAFAPDGLHFATVGQDNRILIWRLRPFTPLSKTLDSAVDGASAVAFSRDGKYMAAGGIGKITIWDAQSGAVVKTLTNPEHVDIASVAFSPDGKTLAAGDYDARIRLWDVTAGQPLGDPLLGHEAVLPGLTLVMNLAFSPDGRYLVSSAEDSQVILWDVARRAPVHTFTNEQTITSYRAAFSPDGKWLAVGSKKDGALLWDMAKQQIAQTLDPGQRVGAVAFSPDSQTLAYLEMGTGNITRWDMRANRQIGAVINDGKATDTIFMPDLAFADNTTLASAHDRGVTIWNLAPATPERVFHTIFTQQDIWNIAFTPDGKYLATAQNEGPIDVRYAKLSDWEAEACRISNRNLTQAEWQQFIPELPYQTVCPNLPIPAPSQ